MNLSKVRRQWIQQAPKLFALFSVGCSVPDATVLMSSQNDGGSADAASAPSSEAGGTILTSDAVTTAQQDGQTSDAYRPDAHTNLDGAPTLVGAVCGDQRCDPQENATSCCDDCGCPAGKDQVCLGNSCVGKPIHIAAGGDHTCVVLTGGNVLCWGSNDNGELGLTAGPSRRSSPVAVPNLSGVIGMAAGGNFTCALTSGGTVKCWGNNSAGQLGSTSSASSPVPIDVPGVANVQKLSASSDFACAVTADGAVFCWGNNAQGQLGRPKSDKPGAPAIVGGVTSAKSMATGIATGSNFACALLDNGQVSCWGWNYDGQLGDGTTTPRETPAPVSNLSTASQVVATVETSSLSSIFGPTACARLADSTVVCWGDDSTGKLGNPATILESNTPVAVSGLAGVSSIAAGSDFLCAVSSGGIVKCWGSNLAGQLGTGNTELGFSASVAPVSNLTNVISIAAGARHACALLVNGTVYCWGDNHSGQLGDGTLISSAVPVPVI